MWHDHNIFKAVGRFFVQFINTKEDFIDLRSAFKQLFKGEKNEFREFQRPFRFVERTLIDCNFLRKYTPKYDKTLFETKFGQKLLDTLGMKDFLKLDRNVTDKFGQKIYEYLVKGSLASKVIGRTFMRIPLIGVGFLSLLEVPSLIKSLKGKYKIKNLSRQTIKSTVNVVSTVFFGAFAGAVGAFLIPRGDWFAYRIRSWILYWYQTFKIYKQQSLTFTLFEENELPLILLLLLLRPHHQHYVQLQPL